MTTTTTENKETAKVVEFPAPAPKPAVDAPAATPTGEKNEK